MKTMGRSDVPGQEGEALACRHLRAQGFRIVAHNWRCPFGELDLVARDGDTLVFVEVKCRSSPGYGGPEGALTPGKRRRLIAAAGAYLMREEPDLPVRFDVIAICGDALAHYRDAFSAEEPCSLGF
jgi:putative endonuclease